MERAQKRLKTSTHLDHITKVAVYNVHAAAQHMKALLAQEDAEDTFGRGLRHLNVVQFTAKHMKVSPDQVKRVVTAARKNDSNVSEPQDRGRPPHKVPDTHACRELVRGAIVRAAAERSPMTVRTLTQLLAEHNIEVCTKTVRTTLKRWGYKFSRQSGKYYVKECRKSPALIEYCKAFAIWLDATLEGVRLGRGEFKTLVVLDESYCNLNHITSSQWTFEGMEHSSYGGKGGRACIVGAGFYQGKRGKLTGGWVPGTFKTWNAKSNGGKVGAPKKNAPRPAVDDYHGNFDAPLFEKWFTDLCTYLSSNKQKYGKVAIIMDGASYHKRRVDTIPRAKNKHGEMVAWLREKGIAVPTRINCAGKEVVAFKNRLYETIKDHEPSFVKYQACEIAKEHGCFVKYTPQYFPEFQPIERVWGNIKNKIAWDPVKRSFRDDRGNLISRMSQLLSKIKKLANGLKSKDWVGSLGRTFTAIKKFKDIEHESDEESDSSDSDSDLSS